MEKKYPFKFLDSYNQNDTDMFFGRDEEIVALYEMVFQNSILLVYGASGTGKTSLIQCGLAGRFKSYDWLALTIRRGTNINASLEKALIAAGGEDIDDEEAKTNDSSKNLTGLLRLIKGVYLNSFKPIYLIFDQFEELYILGTKDEQEKFIEAVKEIQKAEQSVKMIFSIREEYLGHLFEFEKQVPQLLRKKLRVEPMTLNKVTDVIKGINNFKLSNVRIKADEIDTITQGIFERLKGKKKTLTIQLPYLQVFLDKLYLETTKDETRKADALIELSVLNRIGDIGDVLRNFLEEQVAGISQKLSQTNKNVTPETIWKILSPFSTLEGTKEPISKKELGERLKDIDTKLIDEAVESFVNSRILNFSEAVNLYELAHDSLALRIAEKRSDEEISLLEVRKLIKNQVSLKQDAREFFSKKQLTFIEPFLHKLNLSEEEDALINESKEAEHKADQKKRARRRNVIISIAAATILVIAFLSIFLIQVNNAKNKNIELLSNSYWNNSKNTKAENDYVYALANANMAFSLSKDSDLKKNILMEIENKWPLVNLKNILSAKGQIISAAFIKEGKQVITLNKDHTFRVWDALTGDSIGSEKSLPVKERTKSNMAITPTGNNMIIMDQEQVVGLWDVLSLKAVKMGLTGMKLNGVVDGKISKDDSKYFAVTEHNDPAVPRYTLSVYEFDGKPLFSKPLIQPLLEESEIPETYFSPDGEWVFTKYDSARIQIFNANTGEDRSIVLQQTDRMEYEFDQTLGVYKYKTKAYKSLVKSISFSNHGDTILTANNDSTVRLWDFESGEQIGDSMKHERTVEKAFFNPDGSMILTVDEENSTFIWDTKTTTKSGHAFKLEPGGLPPIFSPDGKQILTIINGTALIWQLLQQKNDPDNNEANNEFYNDPSKKRFFSPDLKKIVDRRTKGPYLMYKILDAETGKSKGQDITSKFSFVNDATESVWFSPDSKRILTMYTKNSIQLLNAEFGTQIGPGIPFEKSGELIFSPVDKEIQGNNKKSGDKKLLIKYDNDTIYKIQLWNIESGKLIGADTVYKKAKQENIQTLTQNTLPDTTANLDEQAVATLPSLKPVFSADGNWVLILFHDNDSVYYELLDAGTGKLKGPKHSLSLSDFHSFWNPIISHDGKMILAPVNDTTAQLLDAETGKQKGNMIRHLSYWHPIYSPDGKWIITCTSDNAAQFIDIETGYKKGNAIKHLNLDLIPNWPLINKNGSRVLTIGDPGTIHLWNSETQKQIKEDFKHESSIPPVFSPDGKLFLTSDYYGTARLYDAETGNQMGPALKRPKSDIKNVIFSDDAKKKKILIVYSKYQGTGMEETTGIIWDAGTGKQIGQEIKDLVVPRSYQMENEAGYVSFSDDGRWLLYQNYYGGDQLLNTEAGDLDIPKNLLDLQVLVSSGYKYDFAIDEKNTIASKEFYGDAGIKKKYNELAEAHYKKCNFTKYNYWKRFNEERAKEIRPDDFQKKMKADSIDSRFAILPAFQMSDSTNKENNGSFLESNQAIYSANKKYLLAYQSDGNLVIYRKEDMLPIWATSTNGFPAYRTVMQYDGNLVVYSAESGKDLGNNAIWASNTWENNAGATLKLEDDGNLVIYNTKSEAVWQSYSMDRADSSFKK